MFTTLMDGSAIAGYENVASYVGFVELVVVKFSLSLSLLSLFVPFLIRIFPQNGAPKCVLESEIGYLPTISTESSPQIDVIDTPPPSGQAIAIVDHLTTLCTISCISALDVTVCIL